MAGGMGIHVGSKCTSPWFSGGPYFVIDHFYIPVLLGLPVDDQFRAAHDRLRMRSDRGSGPTWEGISKFIADWSFAASWPAIRAYALPYARTWSIMVSHERVRAAVLAWLDEATHRAEMEREVAALQESCYTARRGGAIQKYKDRLFQLWDAHASRGRKRGVHFRPLRPSHCSAGSHGANPRLSVASCDGRVGRGSS